VALTVLQYWQQQLTIYQAAQTAAQATLADAQARLAAAAKKVNGDPNAAPGPLNDGDQKTLAKTGAAIAAKRAQLAAETSPPDAAALVDEIAALIVTQRSQTGTVLDDLDEIAAAQAAADAAAATHARADARVGEIEAAIVAAQAADDRRAALKAAIAAPPLSTLKADATTFLGSSTVTNATTRIGKNFPAEIMTIGDKRRDTRVSRIAALQTSVNDAEDALATENATDNGLAGQAEQKRIAFERAQQVLADYVATAASRFAQAGVVMSSLDAIETAPAGTVADVLTDPEKARLTALKVTGAAAEPTAENLDSDLNDVFTAESALDTQILAAIGANPDSVSADAAVAARRTAITTARNTFTGALAAFAAAGKPDLDTWEAAIPDQGWKVLLDYEQGLDSLNALAGTTPATLAAAMDTAEDAYATALQTAAVAERKAAAIADEIALRQQRLDSASAAIGARLPSAIRGDSY
jgi:hypothetical protein